MLSSILKRTQTILHHISPSSTRANNSFQLSSFIRTISSSNNSNNSSFPIDLTGFNSNNTSTSNNFNTNNSSNSTKKSYLMSNSVPPMYSNDNAAPEKGHGFDYDLIIIGGGSGGLSAAQEAIKFQGLKVAVFDFVKPSPQGTIWGLGGTCVNVGCIPKKLFHTAGLLGGSILDASFYGWSLPTEKPEHNWQVLVGNVRDYIKSINFSYRSVLATGEVDYHNKWASFIDPHTVKAVDKNGVESKYSARRFIIATGLRPNIPDDVVGAREHAITSDDLFFKKSPPGKTLVVGASYVALECAGFLAEFGYDTTVMVRSILLRGFDTEIAGLIGSYMAEESGVKFIRPATPTKIEKQSDGRLKVSYLQDGGKSTGEEVFDTVVYATGRSSTLPTINPSAAGLTPMPSGKISTKYEQTSVPHIYAVGDCIEGLPELSPFAIQTGRMLIQRLYGGSKATMTYDHIPTTVFTPIEYGSVGLSEEDAVSQYGVAKIEVYHVYYQPLEWTIAQREMNRCFMKLVVDKSDSERVLGLHVLGPNAGEVTQGFAVAIRMGARKSQLDSTVGIHPTNAEVLCSMKISKSSGESPLKTSC